MSIIWTPLSHTALIRGSCPAISVCKRELIQIELNTAPQGKCNETAKIFLETIIDVVFAQMALKTFLCNKLSSFSINQSINQSFILTRYVKELKNSFKIRTCKKKKRVSVCLTYMFPSFLPLMPDVSWTNSELLSNLALKSVKTKTQNIRHILISILPHLFTIMGTN